MSLSLALAFIGTAIIVLLPACLPLRRDTPARRRL
jgi:hypothetical protein